MTPIKKDLTTLELSIFFKIVNKNVGWRLYWAALRNNWVHPIKPDAVFNSKRNDSY